MMHSEMEATQEFEVTKVSSLKIGDEIKMPNGRLMQVAQLEALSNGQRYQVSGTRGEETILKPWDRVHRKGSTTAIVAVRGWGIR